MTARAVAGATVSATVAVAAVASYLLVRADAVDIAGLLARHHAAPYALGLWWALVAPVPLLGAALLTRRTPWPWVVVCTLHLGVVLAVTVRLRHVVPDQAAAGVVGTVVLGVVSVVACVARRPDY